MSAGEQAQGAEIAIDVNDDTDRDSSFEDDVTAESTTSLNDSILQYRTLHGRRYHNFKDSEYWGPNDESQNEQLDIGHHMLTLLLGGELFLAPIGDHPQVGIADFISKRMLILAECHRRGNRNRHLGNGLRR